MAGFDIDITDSGSKAVKSVTDSLGGFLKSMGGAQGGLEGMQGSMGGMAEAAGPWGIAIQVATTALLAFTSACFAAIVATVGIVQQREALRATFDALGQGANAGQKTLAMLDKLSQVLPFTTDQLAKMAQGLMAAGIQGKALEDGIKAIAAATAIMGESGGAAAEKLIKKLAEASAIGAKVKIDKGFLKQLAAAGLNAGDLAAALGVPVAKLESMNLNAKQLGDAMEKALLKKGKGPLEEMGLTWDSISAKLKEGISSLFEGLGPDVKALMTEVKSLFSEFFRGGTLAKGAMGGVKAVMHALLSAATVGVNFVHLALLKLYIAWLRIKIAIAPVTSAIAKFAQSKSFIAGMNASLLALKITLIAIAIITAIALLPFIIGAALFIAAVLLVVAAIGMIIDWVGDCISTIGDLASGAIDAASSFIDGLVSGIQSGAGAVVDAVKALAKSAIAGLKGILGIASDSKVTTKFGLHTTGGLETGIEKGTGDVQAAAKGAGRAAIDGMGDGAAGASGGRPGDAGKPAGGSSMVFEHIEIHVEGKADDVLTLTEEAVAALFERIALREGVLPAPAGG